MKTGFLLAATAVMLCGCATSLSTLPDRRTTADRGDALLGVPYSLPMVQFDVTLTRSLDGCPEISEAPLGASRVALASGKLKLGLKAEAKEQFVPGERYVVDYEALDAPFKTMGFGFSAYPSGILKSMNVSADDQSAEAIKSGVGIALTVASMAAGAPVPVMPRSSSVTESFNDVPTLTRSDQTDLKKAVSDEVANQLTALAGSASRITAVACTASSAAGLAAIKHHEAEQKRLAGELKRQTKAVERLTAVAPLRAATRMEVTKLNEALELQHATQLTIETHASEASSAAGKLKTSEEVLWPVAFNASQDGLEYLSDPSFEAGAFAEAFETRQVVAMSAAAVDEWLGRAATTGAENAFNKLAARNARAAQLYAKASQNLKAALRDRILAGLRADPTVALIKERGLEAPTACLGNNASVATCLASQLTVGAQLHRKGLSLLTCGDPGAIAGDCAGPAAFVEIADGRRSKGFEARREDDREVAATGDLGRRARDENSDRGIFVRPPGKGVLTLCRAGPAAARNAVQCQDGDGFYASEIVAAPQLGQLRFLPFRNAPFQANVLALELREDGSIEKFEYKKTKAEGVAALAAAQDALNQYKTYRDDRDEKKKTALDDYRKEELAKIQFEIDTLTKREALLKLKTPTDDEKEAIDAEIARLTTQKTLAEAKLAAIKAEAALAEAAAKT